MRRNAAVALCRDGRIVAAIEQERVTRTRDVGIGSGGFPREAVDMAVRVAGAAATEIGACAFAEEGISPPSEWNRVPLDHIDAHAATAFLTSPFPDAAVVVCSHRAAPEVAVFRADAEGIHDIQYEWSGAGFSRLYSMITEGLGLVPRRDEHHTEALARQGRAGFDGLRDLFSLERDRIRADPQIIRRIAESLASHDPRPGMQHEPRTMSRETRVANLGVQAATGGARAAVAHTLQARLGDLLLEFLGDVRTRTAAPRLCLAGGLFYNTNLATRVRESGLFDHVFIPLHPGNAGLATGCALLAAPESQRSRRLTALSPFLGPQYSDAEIKAVLDNCKLSYEYPGDGELIRQTVAALRRGHLVGWFHGRMEWGPRALGCRSILADPLAPYVLENLNTYLKRRDPPRSYAVSVCEEDLGTWFEGPSPSPFMQFEHRVKDPVRFAHIMSHPDAPIRVHTVGPEPGLLRQLLKACGTVTGTPVLVNTSFNGFHEPIVCSSRDAVRVFYGSGLDLLVVGNFVMRK